MRLALVSWPLASKTPDVFVVLGEMYDKSKQDDLSTFLLEISFLSPFRLKEKKVLSELNIYRKKYKLTSMVRIIGDIPPETVLRSPVLCDLDKMTIQRSPRTASLSPKKGRIVVVFSYPNPIQRGDLLSEVLSYRPETIFLIGDRAVLMKRFLLCRSFPSSKIFIQDELDLSLFPDDQEVFFACLSKDVSLTLRKLKKMRNLNMIPNIRFRFIVKTSERTSDLHR